MACVISNLFFILPLLVLLSTSPFSSSLSPSVISPLSPSLPPSVISPSSPSLSPSETSPLPSSLSPSTKVTKQLLYQLCAIPSIDNHFCIAWLTSDQTFNTLDLNGLLGSVLLKTEQFGFKTLALMKGLASTTTDSTLKIPYGSCVTDYELSIKALEGANVYASSKEYELAAQAAFKAFDNISKCEADLEGLKNVPDYVSRSNLLFERMCSIGQAFSYALVS